MLSFFSHLVILIDINFVNIHFTLFVLGTHKNIFFCHKNNLVCKFTICNRFVFFSFSQKKKKIDNRQAILLDVKSEVNYRK